MIPDRLTFILGSGESAVATKGAERLEEAISKLSYLLAKYERSGWYSDSREELPDTIAARRELQEVKKDAARYRWLREGNAENYTLCKPPLGGRPFLLSGDQLDAAIDAQLARLPPE